MEKSKEGGVTIKQVGENFEVIIPAPKNWFIVFLIGLYCSVSAFAILSIVYDVLFVQNSNESLLVAFIFLIIFFFVFRIFYWSLFGKEILQFEKNYLTIKKKNALFQTTRICELNLIKDLWVEREPASLMFMLYIKRKYINIGSFGLVRIQYGTEMIKYGASLNEREANYIVSFLKEKNILKNN